ncbi:DUF4142 domain-containing protein [Chryseobacterium sp. KACC 21268]|nr:DUF4142 domain-containing protein [Chryseobacterium sp. KACC 21268]
MALIAIISCEKKETTNANSSVDSSAVTADTTVTMTDSTAVPPTTNQSSSNLTAQDKKFADAAAQGGMAEVMLGELSSSSGTHASVKSLGAMMAKDHGKANEELKSWASATGYTLPSSVNAEQQKTYDELKTKKGAEFDRMFADVMVNDHKKVLAAFKKESTEGSEASLKSFATKTVPALEHHLMESEKTKSAVK